jgi:hypothetical protein
MVARWRDWPVGRRIAVLALIAALGLDLVTLAGMRSTSDNSVVTPLVMEHAPRIITRVRDEGEIVREAALRSPFDAVAPVAPLQLASTVVQQSAPPPIRPRLVGTVVEAQGGGFVVVEMPDARMQLVRIGERAGDLRLRSVAANEAVFVDALGGRVALRTSRAGETRP